MKKILLLIFVISFCGCQNQSELQQGVDSKTQRLSDFERYKEFSGMHSDYLAYVFEHMRDELVSCDTRSRVNKTPDELCRDLKEITSSFIQEKLYSERNAFCVEEYFEQGIFSKIGALTRSQDDAFFDLPPIVAEFFLKIDRLPDGLGADQFKVSVETILSDDHFLENCSDDEFSIVAIAAATCIDSYNYWLNNYAAWASEIFGNQNTRGFWGDVWGETKRLSKKDAEAAIIGSPGAIAAGPYGLEVLFASAGVGSVYAAFRPYF